MLKRVEERQIERPDSKLQDKDDVHFAPESGEPTEAGRSHGIVIDSCGYPAGRDQPRAELMQHQPEGAGDEDWESGRHDAVE